MLKTNDKRLMNSQTGQTLIELILAMALAAIFLPALITGLWASRQGKPQQQQRLAALGLLKEAVEATRNVRESGWTGFAVNGTYHPVISGSKWTLVSGSESINSFARRVVISDANRDPDLNGNIIASGGTNDPSTKKVIISVSWSNPYASSVDDTLYMTRYLENNAYIETTQTQFNLGTKSSVAVRASIPNPTPTPDDGEIILGAGGNGDWCQPNLSITALDLPKNGVANAVGVIQGQAFAGTGDNASGVSFANVTITDPPSPAPPAATVAGTFDGYKTNGIFGEPNYAYLATDNNFKEIVIIDLLHTGSNGKYLESGYFNVPGNGNGTGIYVSGNVGYMTDNNIFYTFDLTSRGGSRPELGQVALAGDGKKIVVIGSKAYVVVDSISSQLQIVNVSNPASLTISANISVPGKEGKDVFVNQSQTRAYLATETSSTQREFFILDLGTNTVLGGYDTNGMDPKGVTVVSGGRAIVGGTGFEEYQVIDITNENLNPLPRCGGLNIGTGVNGVSSVFTVAGRAYSYIITGDITTEFKIIEGGPGGGNYSSQGTFTSSTFDPGYNTVFNRVDVDFSKPAGTDINFQVAVASAISGSCNGVTFTYVGPGGTGNPGDFFTTGGPIPLTSTGTYQNPGRCFKYKVNFTTTDSTFTPIFKDITVNYSP
ncbi:hypothetical protein A2627_04245 [Candidatus Woesebacteria bacterium RIFCSPHIGHO2_01_FULL_39_28]|uniref:Prepilin-type N-terminal cleavage/methylation domain-containing protein n=1 Tax=Candidatus Woesebacteria bacterium RIFCSPHIGHO2_01_FULL_39_28 TaxID=1802496 RepID=A0A1F7YG29_9BACT|nr:MAG: hypothetical protein A2627_04245 [Candidatus Woesebacteria bacterium RIFCSPHIGHO2_01_FULL_39_28]OGM58431.1 MAG: hypothetical protein A3A50_00980 [Candidatus Woesebacteria bacterium RIFCSPLOWO2_01_FULL_38_20]